VDEEGRVVSDPVVRDMIRMRKRGEAGGKLHQPIETLADIAEQETDAERR